MTALIPLDAVVEEKTIRCYTCKNIGPADDRYAIGILLEECHLCWESTNICFVPTCGHSICCECYEQHRDYREPRYLYRRIAKGPSRTDIEPFAKYRETPHIDHIKDWKEISIHDTHTFLTNSIDGKKWECVWVKNLKNFYDEWTLVCLDTLPVKFCGKWIHNPPPPFMAPETTCLYTSNQNRWSAK